MRKTVTRENQSRARACMVANRVTSDEAKSPFKLPDDGWWQVLSLGEFPARWEGGSWEGEDMVQVIDDQAVTAIKSSFDACVECEKTKGKQFAGLLVDYDHFSHQSDKPTEAACWIFEVEKRDDGLWARGKWTSTGETKVVNGDYRFASAVLSGFQWVDGNRYRPTCLDRVALTNDPRIKTLAPISVPNRDNQQSKGMNERTILIELLGLAANADDAAITAGVATLKTARTELAEIKNRMTESDKTVKDLTEKVSRLTGDLIEHDMREYDAVIANKDDIKAALVANREGTLKVLKSLKPTAQNTQKQEDRKSRTPVYNRDANGGRNPGPADGEPTQAQRDQLAQKVRNRAAELLKDNPRIGRANATAQAVKQIESENGVTLVATHDN